MSYNYNELVSQIASSRRLAAEGGEEKINHLQKAVDTLSDLSTKCPMTPLLWMQYSADTAELLETLTQDSPSALETRLQMLELALAEFPGSAILHVHRLQLLSNQNDGSDEEKIRKALDNAIENVGRGSHRNEGELIATIYRLDAKFHAKKSLNEAMESYYQRARIPMKDVNESLNNEFQRFCLEQGKSATLEELHGIEKGRRYESRIYSALVTYEDEVDVAMHSEGILPRHQVNLNDLDWETILKSDEKTFWMGLGGLGSTDAFIQYAKACYRYRHPQNEDEDEDAKDIEATIKALAPCVYERCVAECPTSESLWFSYIKHLHFLVQNDDTFLSRLKSVVDRAVRNCPYSLPLFLQKLNLQLLMADRGKSVMDPDEITMTVQEAIEGKFIASPEACLELHMTAIQVVRRRILSLLALSKKEKTDLAYDGVESVQSSVSTAEMDEANGQEVEDLCDDIREMYDGVDTYLRKNHSAWTEGRSRLWSDRAFTETHLLGPLINLLRDEATTIEPAKGQVESIRCYDKLTKVYQPAHPDSFISYIKVFLASLPTTNPVAVLSKIRQGRWLYQKALRSVGKPKHPSSALDPMVERDYETALRCLCHDYLVFERYFGSDESLAKASKAIEKKLAKAFPNGENADVPAPAPVNNNNIEAQAQESGPGADSMDAEDVTESKAGVDSASKETREESTEEGTKGKKRGMETEDDIQPTKKTKLVSSDSSSKPGESLANKEEKDNDNNDNTAMVVEQKEESKPVPPEQHKVKVGKLDYPAHPFTVRVSYLNVDTEEMDLVDVFRPKCGAIVHAKITRDKHHHDGKGKSKGWGLIQFEQQESVEKALALSEIIGIREKLVTVNRSHMPAVGLVPPGMHRVNPKGGGRSSKQNQKRKEQRMGSEQVCSERASEPGSKQDESKTNDGTAKSSGMGVLAFRPRIVRQNPKHRNVKLSLTDD